MADEEEDFHQPNKDVLVSVRMDGSLDKRVRRDAKKHGRKKSQIIREILQAYYDRIEADEKGEKGR